MQPWPDKWPTFRTCSVQSSASISSVARLSHSYAWTTWTYKFRPADENPGSLRHVEEVVRKLRSAPQRGKAVNEIPGEPRHDTCRNSNDPVCSRTQVLIDIKLLCPYDGNKIAGLALKHTKYRIYSVSPGINYLTVLCYLFLKRMAS